MLPPSLSPPLPAGLPRQPDAFCCFPSGVQSDPEGALWRDPPHYWEEIVWPAYGHAHEAVFENGNFENGKPNGSVKGLVLIESVQQSIGDVVDLVCERSVEAVGDERA